MPTQSLAAEKPSVAPLGPPSSSGSTKTVRRSHSWRHSGLRLAGRSLTTWALLSVASLWLLNSIWARFHIWAYTPHQFLYQNQTLEEVSDLREVVRPLVDENQPFDVIATVWSRNPFARNGEPYSEDVLFSYVIFHGLTLHSKDVHAHVNLSIPLRVFETSSVLENYDLRASFLLVPQSPSLLDGYVEYKSWRPTEWITTVEMSPSGKIGLGQRVQEAVEAYGVTIPLIEFDSLDADRASPVPMTRKISKFPIESTKGKPPAEAHPHVVTRTDLRVVKMTELYNAYSYDAYQRELETNDNLNGRARTYITDKYNWGAALQPQDARNCDRSFRLRGNMETKVKVKIPSKENGGRPIFAWTYAPFMEIVPGSWGPTDLVPMPVHRPSDVEDDSTKLNRMNVTWNVAFTASPPAQILLAEVIGETPISLCGTPSSAYKKAQAQSRAQHIHWLHGHIFSNKANIGRSFVIQTSSTIFRTIILQRLNIDYWKSRSSTVGISQVGLIVMTIGGLISFFRGQYKFWQEGPKDASMGLISFVFACLAIYMSTLMMANALRLERVARFPYFKRREPSRLERASLRMELQVMWLVSILLVTFLAQIMASVLEGVVIVPRAGPAPDDEATTMQARILDGAKDFIPNMLPFLGDVYQLALNYRSKTFAGQYKSAAWLRLLVFCLSCIKSLPWIVGELPVADPLTLSDLVYSAHLVGAVIQAVRYPVVKQDVEDEHSD